MEFQSCFFFAGIQKYTIGIFCRVKSRCINHTVCHFCIFYPAVDSQRIYFIYCNGICFLRSKNKFCSIFFCLCFCSCISLVRHYFKPEHCTSCFIQCLLISSPVISYFLWFSVIFRQINMFLLCGKSCLECDFVCSFSKYIGLIIIYRR